MALALRRAGAADVDALFRIRLSVAENRMSMADLAAIGLTPETLLDLLSGDPDCWIAEADGTPVGFSMADRDDACFFALFVLPSNEGQGVGARLADLAEAALFRHHDVIWLETARDSRAEGFYHARGWTEEGLAGAGDVRLVKRRPSAYSPSSSG